MSEAKPQTTFDLAFSFTMGNEGRFSNVAGDAGGATMWGISQPTLSLWLGRPASVNDVKNLSLDTAKEIYERHYWLPLACDKIKHQGAAMCLFDIGVVRGIGVPPKYAQQICNARGAKLIVDGHLGPLSLEAINALPQTTFVSDFAAKAELGFDDIVAARPSQRKFAAGWQARARRLLTLKDIPDAATTFVPVAQEAVVKVPPEAKPASDVSPVMASQAESDSFWARVEKAMAIIMKRKE